MKKVMVFFALICFLYIPNAHASLFQNGDFENGYEGWSGELTDNSSTPHVVDPGTSSLYQVVSPNNQSEQGLNSTYWINDLFQDFTMDSLAPGEKMELSFSIKWVPSASAQDGISATLSDSTGADTIDLLSSVTDSELLAGTNVLVDITDFARNYSNQDAEIAFTLMDYDLDTSDRLYVDDITFTKTAVPLPPAVVLLLSGLGIIGISRKRGGSIQIMQLENLPEMQDIRGADILRYFSP